MIYKSMLRESGFTIVEILVALSLITVIFLVAVSGSFSTRKNIEETLDAMERSIRFASDEAIIKNSIIRIHFYLDKNPVEYSIEFGNDADFIQPLMSSESDPTAERLSEEDYKKKLEATNKQFTKIKEFEDENYQINDVVKVLGIGTSVSNGLISNLEASVYIYPTGERDSAIIILGTDEEVVALEIDPFSGDFKRVFRTLSDTSTEGREDRQSDLATEIYNEWLKK